MSRAHLDELAAEIGAIRRARRNVTEEQKSYLRGKRYQSEKKAPHRPEKVGNSCPLTTADRLAEEHGVSPRTIKNDDSHLRVPGMNRVQPSGPADPDHAIPPWGSWS